MNLENIQKRNLYLHLKLDDELRNCLEDLSKSEKLSFSALTRTLILKKWREQNDKRA